MNSIVTSRRSPFRRVAASLAVVSLLASSVPARAAGGGSLNAVGDGVADSARGGIIALGIGGAALVGTAAWAIWYFGFRDKGDEPTRVLDAKTTPVDVSKGVKVGLDCAGSDGTVPVTCW